MWYIPHVFFFSVCALANNKKTSNIDWLVLYAHLTHTSLRRASNLLFSVELANSRVPLIYIDKLGIQMRETQIKFLRFNHALSWFSPHQCTVFFPSSLRKSYSISKHAIKCLFLLLPRNFAPSTLAANKNHARHSLSHRSRSSTHLIETSLSYLFSLW